jgi:PmbA protein
MLSTLIRFLESQDQISDWKIKETNSKGEEIFFVNSKVDMTRIKNVTHYLITIYKDFTENGIIYKGSSSFSIHPTSNKTELLEKCKKATANAVFVKNMWYPLVEPSMLKNSKKLETAPNDISSFKDMMKEINLLEPATLSGINSMELFVYEEKKTVANSKGILVKSENPKTYLEIITQEKGSKEEVELYYEIKFSHTKQGNLAEQINNMIKQTRDRSVAEITPDIGACPIILSGSSVPDFLNYYLSKSSAKGYYEKISPFKPNDSLQGKDIQGDLIDLWLDPQLEGSYYSGTFDEDGYPLEKIKIVDKGTLIRYWGDIRYSHYVNAIPPTGGLKNFQVATGSTPLEEFKKDPYVEAVSFSDFQMDTMTGNFGGEIRLGYYFDGTKTIPITKGSIVGNITECQNNLLFSRESQTIMNFKGPLSILIKKATVSGS